MSKPPTSPWTTTRLAVRLQELSHVDGDAQQAWALLQRHMPAIEIILEKGATSPKDFTLHDADHSRRVAEWMARIIPAESFTGLTGYEVMLLLLAAYLHDIGMTPEACKVSRHLQHLLFPRDEARAADWLTEAEAAALQSWLDADGRGVVAPITTGSAAEHDLRLANELLTYYSRYRHNDWSAEFIDRQFAGEELPHYAQWKSDLIMLCRSHHDGYDELSSRRFDPRPAGSGEKVVHLRYLACTLRVADVLDVDPERTPEVIFRHRAIAPGSELYWRKEHLTWIHFDDDAGQLSFVARSPEAVLEKAMRDTAAQIATELQLCARLARERPFTHCSFAASSLNHYIWRLSPWLTVDIRPEDNAYVYIEGAFRPNTERLLNLFGGTALYRSEFDAVRELLQNAFDAVREAIAYERLVDGGKTPTLASALAAKHLVELRFEADGATAFLVCSDTGTGMTRDIIEKHVLVSGTAQRREIVELERQCRSAGFSLERTGRFGIGVLAYFMIAEQVTLTTRRHQLAEGDEGCAWQFESAGVGSFGELRVADRRSPGSEIRLELRAGAGEDRLQWFKRLSEYLVEALVHLPCRFEFRTTLAGGQPLSLAPGWSKTPANLLAKHLGKAMSFSDDKKHLVTAAAAEALETTKQRFQKAHEDAVARTDFVHEEGDLPEGFGRYRLVLPFFRNRGGCSLAYLPITDSGLLLSVNRIGPNDGCLIRPETNLAWRGMGISGASLKLQRALVDVDLTKESIGRLKIDRSHISLTAEAEATVLKFLSRREQGLIGRYVSDRSASLFETLDSAILRMPFESTSCPGWLTRGSETGASWTELKFPVTDRSIVHDRNALQDVSKVLANGKEVKIAPPVQLVGESENRNQTLSRIASVPRVLAIKGKFRLLPVWESDRIRRIPRLRSLTLADFPPKWPVLCNAPLLSGPVFWNNAHPAIRKATDDALESTFAAIGKALNPLPVRAAILSNPTLAAAWIILTLGADIESRTKYGSPKPRDLWAALVEKDTDFLQEIWRLVLGAAAIRKDGSAKPIIRLGFGDIDVITPSKWTSFEAYRQAKEVRTYLPDVPPTWRCEVK